MDEGWLIKSNDFFFYALYLIGKQNRRENYSIYNQIIVECGEGMAAVIEHKKEKNKDQFIKKLKKLLRKNQKSADNKEYSHRLINNSR